MHWKILFIRVMCIFQSLMYFTIKYQNLHLLGSLSISSENSLSIGELSRHCCMKALILLLAVNIVSLVPWGHKLPPFIFKKISARYPTWGTHTSSLILLGKNGGLWKHTSAFPWDYCRTFVCSRRALNVLPISSHRILKRLVLKGWDLMKLIFLLLHQGLS